MRKLTGQAYLSNYGLPQFLFHVTTAYAILRHNGLSIGKRDFMGTYWETSTQRSLEMDCCDNYFGAAAPSPSADASCCSRCAFRPPRTSAC